MSAAKKRKTVETAASPKESTQLVGAVDVVDESDKEKKEKSKEEKEEEAAAKPKEDFMDQLHRSNQFWANLEIEKQKTRAVAPVPRYPLVPPPFLIDSWDEKLKSEMGMLPMPTNVPDPGEDEVISSTALFKKPWEKMTEENNLPMFFMLPVERKRPKMISAEEHEMYVSRAKETLKKDPLGLMVRMGGKTIYEKQAAAEWLCVWSNRLHVSDETHESMLFRLGRLMSMPNVTPGMVWEAAVRLRNSLMQSYMECRLYSELYDC